MCLLAKLGDHRSNGNRDINSYINSYMNTSKKAELTTSIRHVEKFSKLRLPIFNSKVPVTIGRKIARSRWWLRRLHSKTINRIRGNQNHMTSWELLRVSHHLDKFSDNGYFDKWNLMFLICHVTSHNDLFKWSCDFMILQDNVTKGSSNIMVRNSSRLVTILPSFVAIDTNGFRLSRNLGMKSAASTWLVSFESSFLQSSAKYIWKSEKVKKNWTRPENFGGFFA